MTVSEDHKSDRLNFNVALYKGCTLNEIAFASFLGFSVSIFSMIITFLIFFSLPLVGFALGIPLGFLVTYGLILYVGSAKQNRPHGFYQQLIMLNLENIGLMTSPFIRRSGPWSVRRFL